MPHLKIYYVAVEKDGKERIFGEANYTMEFADEILLKNVREMVELPGNQMSRQYGAESWFFKHPTQWDPLNLRRDKILTAVTTSRMVGEAIPGEAELRSDLGNRIAELNKLFPGLQVTVNEALQLYHELATEALRIKCRPKVKLGTPRKSVASRGRMIPAHEPYDPIRHGHGPHK